MNLTNLLLGLLLTFLGLSTLGIITISSTVIGILYLVVGILILVNAFHPINVNLGRNNP